jgi:hypothetical protein
MVKALVEVLRNEIKWPSEEEWQDLLQKFNPLLPPSISGCISVIGRSKFQMQQPSTDSDQHEHYSANKKDHSLNVVFIVLLDGTIIYHSATDSGSVTKHCGMNVSSERN